jgi:hypothetical protein
VNVFKRMRIPLISEPLIQSLRLFSVGHRFLEKKLKTGEGVEDSIDFSSGTNLYRFEFFVEKEFAKRNSFWLCGFTPKVHTQGAEMSSTKKDPEVHTQGAEITSTDKEPTMNPMNQMNH